MQPLENEFQTKITQANQQYHRLILILNHDTRVKSDVFNKIAEQLSLGYINLGLELSQRLLNLTERQRTLRLSQVVEQIINKFSKETPVILDHIEILFDPSLKVDPLRLIRGLSRDQTLIAVWKGHITNGYLTYAIPEHPEYHKYPIQDLNFINADDLLT